jgi:hypothetical protein
MNTMMIEELETVAAPSDLTDFMTGAGFGIAVTLVILGC